MHSPLTVSVVIPAFNEEENIAACLDALVVQDTERPVEVIVVDNASTDKTSAIAKSYAKKIPHLKVILEKKRGRGAARCRGCKEATGDILFSTDADAIVPPNWISAMLRELERDKHVACVTGLPMITDCEKMENAFFNAYVVLHMHAYRLIFGHFSISGFNFAMRRSVYDAIGGFNPEADAYEDLELSFAIHKKKLGKIKLVEEPRVIFSGRRFKKGFLRGGMDYFKTFTVKFVLKKERVILQVVDNEGRPVEKDNLTLGKIIKDLVQEGMKKAQQRTLAAKKKQPQRTGGKR